MVMDATLIADRGNLRIRTKRDTRNDDGEQLVYLHISVYPKGEETIGGAENQITVRLSMDQLAYLHAKNDEVIHEWVHNEPTIRAL